MATHFPFLELPEDLQFVVAHKLDLPDTMNLVGCCQSLWAATRGTTFWTELWKRTFPTPAPQDCDRELFIDELRPKVMRFFRYVVVFRREHVMILNMDRPLGVTCLFPSNESHIIMETEAREADETTTAFWLADESGSVHRVENDALYRSVFPTKEQSDKDYLSQEDSLPPLLLPMRRGHWHFDVVGRMSMYCIRVRNTSGARQLSWHIEFPSESNGWGFSVDPRNDQMAQELWSAHAFDREVVGTAYHSCPPEYNLSVESLRKHCACCQLAGGSGSGASAECICGKKKETDK
eukprot:TRINITY_DN10877_c0_g1_i1.p1 TRINITY_DN10877_c0_g1~~TRINITY_DN10877_c0_g1_i1.p1  ORF type:complete len:306 (-),score=22.72 TRINITY_DN10877_c0_g1_i1:163-1041(-)